MENSLQEFKNLKKIMEDSNISLKHIGGGGDTELYIVYKDESPIFDIAKNTKTGAEHLKTRYTCECK